MQYKAVLFDFDGVIADTMKYHVLAWQQVFSKYNINIEPEDIYFQEGQIADIIARKIVELKELSLNESELEEIVRQKRAVYKTITRAQIYPAAKELVTKLKNMPVKIGLVTGSIIPNIVVVTGEAFLKNFQVIVTGDAVKHNKPHPEPYLTAAQKLKITPTACIVIENAPLGIRAAKHARMYCIAVKTTIKNERHLNDADLIVDDLSEIPVDSLIGAE